MIALPSVLCGDGLPPRFDLRPGLWTTTELPLGLPDHWRTWVGSLRAETLSDGDLFIVAGGPAEEPDVLDDENEGYVRQAFSLYLGLLVSDFFYAHAPPHRLTGANRGGEVDVRSIGELEAPLAIPGTPLTEVTAARLVKAAELADAIDGVRRADGFERMGRALQSFRDGIEERNVAEKLHQFLRCVEGFIIPEVGNTLSRLRSRTEVFIGPGHHERVTEWFNIRSAVEHLHPPDEAVPSDDLRVRRLRIMRRAMEVEAVARHCLQKILLNAGLRGRFRTDGDIEAFWDEARDNRQDMWGEPLDLGQVEDSFEERFVDDHDLGIEEPA